MVFDTDGKLLQAWMQDRMDRVRDDWDELIVMTGPERSGKSGAAFLLAGWMDPSSSDLVERAREAARKLRDDIRRAHLTNDALAPGIITSREIDDLRAAARRIRKVRDQHLHTPRPGFDPARQMVFTGQAFRRRAVELEPYKALVLDEAIKGGFARRATSGDNVGLAEYLTVGGERNLLNFVCWPGARWLDPILREWRSTWNINVLRRYRDHAVYQMRQFHEGEKVYDKPRVKFTFALPKPRGPKWDAYRKCKSDFVQRVGRTGGDDGHDAGEAFYEQTLRVLRGKVRQIREQL